MAHLHLVSIHPWADGNGCMSRSLQTLLVARGGFAAAVGRITRLAARIVDSAGQTS